MAEIRRGSETGTGSERLPWLEPVEDEDDGDYSSYGEEPGGGYGGMMLAVLAILVAIAVVTAGVVWFRHHRAATADIGETIHPDPGPYKIKPPNPGGLDTDATGQVASATSAGGDIDSVLDLNAVPEQPVATRARPGAPAPLPPPAQQPAPPPQPAHQPQPQQSLSQMPVPVAKSVPVPPPAPLGVKPKAASAAPIAEKPPVAAKASGGGSIQLGAFSTEAKAKAVWKSLTGRFRYLQDMTPVILPVESGDTQLFRLRATGGALPSSQICGQLRIAGETCAVVGG